MYQLFSLLFSENRGSMAIETAIVTPVLVLLGLGTFEVGNIVSRQHELQSAASEGEIIALAAAQGATTDLTRVKDILKVSVDLSDDQIAVSRFYRCNAATTTVTTTDSCAEDDIVSSYIKLDLSDSYTPIWTEFGVGSKVDLDVERTIQLS